MKDLNEKQEKNTSQEDMQAQEIQRLKEVLSNYEVETLISSPRIFNKWMLSEILKLKEATNQIGEALNIILSSYEQAPEEEAAEPEPAPKPAQIKKPMYRKVQEEQ